MKLNRGTSNVDWYHWCGIFIALCGEIISSDYQLSDRILLPAGILFSFWGGGGPFSLFSLCTYLWQTAVVPDVAVVGEAVVNKAQLALLYVLFDRVHLVLCRDLNFKRKRNIKHLEFAVRQAAL